MHKKNPFPYNISPELKAFHIANNGSIFITPKHQKKQQKKNGISQLTMYANEVNIRFS